MEEKRSKPKTISLIKKNNLSFACSGLWEWFFHYHLFWIMQLVLHPTSPPPSSCLSQGWSVPVGGLQVEPEQLRIPTDRTGSGTVTTGGQHSLTLSVFFVCSPFILCCLFFFLISPSCSHSHLLITSSFFLSFCFTSIVTTLFDIYSYFSVHTGSVAGLLFLTENSCIQVCTRNILAAAALWQLCCSSQNVAHTNLNAPSRDTAFTPTTSADTARFGNVM